MGLAVDFIQCRSGGREIARLGIVEIGYVRDFDHGRRGRAGWLCILPPYTFQSWKSAPDLTCAKRALIHSVADWLEAAGMDSAGHELRNQADAMQRAVA